MHSEGYCSRSVCVCVSVQATHLRLAQLSDKLDILAVSVSCSLVFIFGVFRIMASFRAHGSRPFFIRETGSFSTFLPYTTLVIARVR